MKTYVIRLHRLLVLSRKEIVTYILHITISDKDGNAFGGHLKNDSIVGITAEVVIGELEGLVFKREFDKSTGYDELVIES